VGDQTTWTLSRESCATSGDATHLVPSLHHRRDRWAALAQIALIVLGAGTIWLMREAIHIG